MNFPEAVMLNDISLSVGSILDEGAFDIFCEPNQMWPSPFNRIIFVPQLVPLTLIFRDRVPPYFCTKNFIVLRRICHPKTPINLKLANCVPFDERPVVRGFVPIP